MNPKMLLLLIGLTVFTSYGTACDICGCGAGSYYVGILPEFKKRFIGMRYQHKSLITHLSASGNRSYLTTDEIFHIAEIWGAANFGKHFRVMGFIPYNFNQRLNQGITTGKNGLGDIAVYGYYKIFNTEKTTVAKKRLIHSLWAGAGIKLPSGSYNNTEKNVTENIQNTFQLGTGSTDFVLNAMYDIRLQDVGINTNISYKLNMANAYEYRYGNKLTVNFLAYHKFRLANKNTIAPNAGLLYETANRDSKNKNTVVEVSGGFGVTAAGGFEWSIGSLGIGANIQVPVSQNLANGKVKAGNRAMVHISIGL